jgi:hypothetical protein
MSYQYDHKILNPYRFGFNGQEHETGIKQGTFSAEFWMYYSQIGRRWNTEPLIAQYPHLSSYATFNNNPILFVDINGAKGTLSQEEFNKKIDKIILKNQKIIDKAIGIGAELSNAYIGYKEGILGSAILTGTAVPTAGATIPIGVYLVGDGAYRVISAIPNILFVLTESKQHKLAPDNLLGVLGREVKKLEDDNNGYENNSIEESLEALGNLSYRKSDFKKALREVIKDKKNINKVKNVLWKGYNLYKDIKKIYDNTIKNKKNEPKSEKEGIVIPGELEIIKKETVEPTKNY